MGVALVFAWAEPRGLLRPAEVDKPVLEAFQRWLWAYRKEDGRPLAIVTQRSHLGAVQVFFAWLCRENILPANPAADLDLPRRPPRALPRSLSLEEVETILAVPDVSDPLGLRDRAILETLYARGMRRMEIANLDVGDLDRRARPRPRAQGQGREGPAWFPWARRPWAGSSVTWKAAGRSWR